MVIDIVSINMLESGSFKSHKFFDQLLQNLFSSSGSFPMHPEIPLLPCKILTTFQAPFNTAVNNDFPFNLAHSAMKVCSFASHKERDMLPYFLWKPRKRKRYDLCSPHLHCTIHTQEEYPHLWFLSLVGSLSKMVI